ncbi:MAG: CPBP family intramembrane metalloprotease [Armatimonadetes bacterium]|nr:CPBP family intramembrane metalloprotease [Armatimonadota bacterium]
MRVPNRLSKLYRIAAVAAIAAFSVALVVGIGERPGDALPRFLGEEAGSTLPADIAYRVGQALQRASPELEHLGHTLEELAVMMYERLAYGPLGPVASARVKLAIVYGERGFSAQAREVASALPASGGELVRAAVLVAWVYGNGPRPPDLSSALLDLDLLDPWLARLCRLKLAQKSNDFAQVRRLKKEVALATRQTLAAACVACALWGAVLVAGCCALLYWLARWLFTPTRSIPLRRPPLVRPWQAIDALELGAVIIALVVVVRIFGAAAIARLPGTESWRLVVDAAGYVIAVGLTLLWLRWRLRKQRLSTWRLLGLNGPACAGVTLGVGAYGALIASAVVAAAAAGYLFGPAEIERQAFPLDALRNFPVAAAYGLLAIILAPAIEESIFRGFIYAGLRRRLGAGPAAFASAIIFALAHVGMPVAARIGIVFLAAALAYAYEVTRNLWVSIGMHMTHNALVFAVLVLAAL